MSLLSVTRGCLLLTGIFASTFSSQAFAERAVRLNFGIYTSNKPSAMVKVYRPILKELEANMSRRLDRDVDIRMKLARNYEQGISHLVDGRVDFSAFGAASYVKAKRMDKGINILAVENINNAKVLYGIIAVGVDSPITSIHELKGKSFAFGNEGSTIGRFLSQLELEEAGIRASDLERYEYLGRHDKVGKAVGAGEFDAGALNEKNYKRLVDAGEPIRELMRFPNMTTSWIARAGLDQGIFEALTASLLEVSDKETLAPLKIEGFLEGSDTDFKVVRKAMENNQAFFADHDEETVLSAASKAEELAANEPAMHAAVAGNTATIDMNDRATITHDSGHDMASHPGGGADSGPITVNISVPRNLFQPSANGKPNQIIINLSLPETESENNTTPAIER